MRLFLLPVALIPCLAPTAFPAGAEDASSGGREVPRSLRRAPASEFPRVYSMPSAIHFSQEAQWQEFLRRQDVERAAERALIQSAAAPRASRDSRPAADSSHRDDPSRPPAPPVPRPEGPRGPGSLSEFKDTFAAVVRGYIAAQSRAHGGVFAVNDDRNGRTYRLRLNRIHVDGIRMLRSTQAVACVDFETVGGPKRSVDLDFELDKDWDWEVGRIFVHGINGRRRFAYDDANRRVVAVAAEASEEPAVPKPSAPAHLSAEVRFHEPSGDGRLEGGEQARLEVTVANAGPGPAYRVRLLLAPASSMEGLSMPQEVVFGDLKAGEFSSKEAPLAASEALPSGKAAVTLNVSEGNGFDTEPVLVEFETKAYEPPRLELAGIRLPGGAVKGGETTKVSVTVVNSGRGAASGVRAALRLGGGDLFMAGEPFVTLGELAPGESKSADFEFFVNRRVKAGTELPVSLTVTEEKQRYGADIPLRLELDRAVPARRVLSIAGRAGSRPAPAPGPEDVDTPPRTGTPVDPNAYAVVIGIEKYRDLPGVDYAARDAQAMYDYLTESMGFKPENVVLLQNERAALADLTTYLGPWLADRAGRGSRIFVYYAGHGAPDPKTGEGYVIPYDGSPGYAQTRGYPLKRLYEELSALPVDDVLVALDSCFSGAGGRSLLAEGTRPLVRVASMPSARNVVTLSAAGGDQISASSPESRHGLLTYFILKGLRGGADADGNGRITTLELFRYLKPAVVREARRQHVEQEPVLFPPIDAIGSRGARVWLVTR